MPFEAPSKLPQNNNTQPGDHLTDVGQTAFGASTERSQGNIVTDCVESYARSVTSPFQSVHQMMAGSNNVYPERHPGIGTTVGELAGTLTDICLLSKVKWLPPLARASLSEFGAEVANQAATGAIYSGLLTPVQQGQEQFKARLQGAFVGAGTFGCMGAAAQWGPYASGLAGGLANVQFDALAHGQAIGNASDYVAQPLAFMVTNKVVGVAGNYLGKHLSGTSLDLRGKSFDAWNTNDWNWLKDRTIGAPNEKGLPQKALDSVLQDFSQEASGSLKRIEKLVARFRPETPERTGEPLKAGRTPPPGGDPPVRIPKQLKAALGTVYDGATVFYDVVLSTDKTGIKTRVPGFLFLDDTKLVFQLRKDLITIRSTDAVVPIIGKLLVAAHGDKGSCEIRGVDDWARTFTKESLAAAAASGSDLASNRKSVETGEESGFSFNSAATRAAPASLRAAVASLRLHRSDSPREYRFTKADGLNRDIPGTLTLQNDGLLVFRPHGNAALRPKTVEIIANQLTAAHLGHPCEIRGTRTQESFPGKSPPADLQEKVRALRSAAAGNEEYPHVFNEVWDTDGKESNVSGILTLEGNTLVFQTCLPTARSASPQAIGEGEPAQSHIGDKPPAGSTPADEPVSQPKLDTILLGPGDLVRIATIGYLMAAAHPGHPCEIRWPTGTNMSPRRFQVERRIAGSALAAGSLADGVAERPAIMSPTGAGRETSPAPREKPTLVVIPECVNTGVITELTMELTSKTLPVFWARARAHPDKGFSMKLDANPIDPAQRGLLPPTLKVANVRGRLHFSPDGRTVTYYPPEDASVPFTHDLGNALLLRKTMGISEIHRYNREKRTIEVLPHKDWQQ